MKKLIFMFAAIVAVSFASCGNHTDATADANDSDSVAVDSLDSVAVDSVDTVVLK